MYATPVDDPIYTDQIIAELIAILETILAMIAAGML